MSNRQRTIQPAGWPRPKGYANGIAARGEVLYVAGQVGWDETERVVSDDFVLQFDQALANVIAVVEAAGGKPTDIVRLTVFATDVEAYKKGVRQIGEKWRARMGRHYPAMSLIGIAALVEEGAKVEIEATAVLEG